MSDMQIVIAYVIVDEDRAYGDRLERAFKQRGYADVEAANTYDAGLAAFASRLRHRAIVDMKFADERTGFDLCHDIKLRWPATRVVISTNYPSLEAMRIATSVGAADLIMKTEDVPEILHAFARQDRAWVDTSRIPLVPPTLEEVQWEHINRVLTLVGGHPKLAAEILGIDRSTLYRKLQHMPSKSLSRAAHLAEQLLRQEAPDLVAGEQVATSRSKSVRSDLGPRHGGTTVPLISANARTTRIVKGTKKATRPPSCLPVYYK